MQIKILVQQIDNCVKNQIKQKNSMGSTLVPKKSFIRL